MASIAISVLGRVGRAALKILEAAGGAGVVAVNDLIPPDNPADLLGYETVDGRRRKAVTAAGGLPVIGGRRVPVDGTLVKVLSWYDDEWGFTCTMIREAFTVLGLPAPDLSPARS